MNSKRILKMKGKYRQISIRIISLTNMPQVSFPGDASNPISDWPTQIVMMNVIGRDFSYNKHQLKNLISKRIGRLQKRQPKDDSRFHFQQRKELLVSRFEVKMNLVKQGAYFRWSFCPISMRQYRQYRDEGFRGDAPHFILFHI